MHETSMNAMRKFVEENLDKDKELTILDVGSYNVNGSYKELFAGNDKWTYVGMDLEEGPNVDLVAKGLYDWGLRDGEHLKTFDVVISGQCLEHVEDTHQWIKQVDLYMKPGSACCIIAPWKYDEHRYPVDCWRIFPDGIKFLARMCNWSEVQVYKTPNDTVGIFRKS